MKARNLALLSSIKDAGYISTDGITIFAESKKEVTIMDVKEVETILSQNNVPHYWDNISIEDGIIKTYYFDFEGGELEYDIFRIDDTGIYRRLNYMPFDWNGKHATGWELWHPVGEYWEDQYEEGMI